MAVAVGAVVGVGVGALMPRLQQPTLLLMAYYLPMAID